MKNRLATLLAGTALALLALPTHAADHKRAEEIVGGRCFLCHGMEGEAASALYPRLAGQHADYIARQLADFKSGRRKSDTMSGMAADLTAEEMKDLGAFFQKKPATRSEATDAASSSAVRTTFAGSITPNLNMSPYSSVWALKPKVLSVDSRTLPATTAPSTPAFSAI